MSYIYHRCGFLGHRSFEGMDEDTMTGDREQLPGRQLAKVLALIALNDENYEWRRSLIIQAMFLADLLGYQCGYRVDVNEPGFSTVAMIELPTGQVSWHMPEHPNLWDGHSTNLKYERIAQYIRDAEATL